jgi:hypothetical protein
MLICCGQCSLSRNKTSLQLHAHLRARPYHPGKDYNTKALCDSLPPLKFDETGSEEVIQLQQW